MVTFWERAAHSVYRYFLPVFRLILILVISHFGFEGRTLVRIASVPGHCLSFTFLVPGGKASNNFVGYTVLTF